MPLRDTIQKVLVIGSGPIVIGQAAEFDYAGTQACRALREEGLEVVLVNSNPATIMTDGAMADHVYIEPLTLETVKRIIQKEKPDGLLSTLGGQTGLTLSMQLAKEGFLEKNGVELPAEASRRRKKSFVRLPLQGFGFPPSRRFWWKSVSPDGKKSNLKLCGIAPGTSSLSAPWKISIR